MLIALSVTTLLFVIYIALSLIFLHMKFKVLVELLARVMDIMDRKFPEEIDDILGPNPEAESP